LPASTTTAQGTVDVAVQGQEGALAATSTKSEIRLVPPLSMVVGSIGRSVNSLNVQEAAMVNVALEG
jgi:hypothetical protein